MPPQSLPNHICDFRSNVIQSFESLRCSICGQPPNIQINSIPPEMKDQIISHITDASNFRILENDHRRNLKNEWTWSAEWISDWPRSSTDRIDSQLLERVFNRTTSLYCMRTSSDSLPKMGNGKVMRFDALFGCVFKEWFLSHNRKPPNVNLLVGYKFLANLATFHSTGPRPTADLIEAHLSRYEQAISALKNIRNEKDSNPQDWGYWRDPALFRVNPLHGAILMVMDQYPEDVEQRDETGKFCDFTSLAQELNVVLVRTGRESELSAPISFKGLKENRYGLPISRPDITESDETAIRVSLATAVRFVVDLEKREENAFPHLRATPLDYVSPVSLKYAASSLKQAKETGSNWNTERAIVEILTGMGPETYELSPLYGSWE